MHVSKSTAQCLHQKHASSNHEPKIGRSEKLSVQQKLFCVRAIKSGGISTPTSVTKKLAKNDEVVVSRMTVPRALFSAGLSSAEKKKKPLLSAKIIRARLGFAAKYRDWTINDWKR